MNEKYGEKGMEKIFLFDKSVEKEEWSRLRRGMLLLEGWISRTHVFIFLFLTTHNTLLLINGLPIATFCKINP